VSATHELEPQSAGVVARQIDSAALSLTTQMDGEIRTALNAFWPEWTIYDVRRRCQIVRVLPSPIETVCADGVPLLEMYPIESHTEQKGDRYVITYTRKFRRLRS